MNVPIFREAVVEAAREFNAGRYFEAHETLEERLDDVPDELWDLALGLIQVAVGYHKAAQGLPGPARMLELGLAKLSRFPGDAGGVALEPLRTRVAADLERIRSQRFDAESLSRDRPRLQPLAKRE